MPIPRKFFWMSGFVCEKKTNLSGKTKIESLQLDLDLVYSCLDLRTKNLDSDYQKNPVFHPGKNSPGILGQLMLMGLVKETGRQYYIRLE